MQQERKTSRTLLVILQQTYVREWDINWSLKEWIVALEG
jgi:hypothetical protein